MYLLRLLRRASNPDMNGYIRVQNLEVFVSPGQKHGVLGTPGSEVRKGLLKRKAVRKIRVGYLGEPGNLSMHVWVVFGLHHNFECINDLQPFIQLDGTDLDDLPGKPYRCCDHAPGPQAW